MDLTGQHLGKYELLERVGRGGMAYVYKAYQPTVDRYVAIKVLHSHLAEDETFLERFRREAQSLGSLRHPHIVSVIDFDVEDGWYYMVMDFIKGQTLEAMLDRRGRLPVDEALHLTAQLAGALDYAHARGRIHRDIKPGNVMFADDAGQHPVITDFGLTRLLDNATITLSGTIAGTPAYMSPEAARGEKVDARGDIYSLGVILYEMVTGQRPYAGETPLSVIMKLVLEPLPPALSINPDLPPAVDEIISKATAKQPEDRYQSAAEFQAALERETGDWGLETGDGRLGTEDGGPQTADRISETVDLRPANNLRVSSQPVSSSPMSSSPPDQPTEILTPAPPARRLPLIAGIALLVVAFVVGFIVFNGPRDQATPETPAPTTAAIVEESTEAAPDAQLESPTVAPAAAPLPTPTVAPAPAPAGVLRFAQQGDDNLRPYTLALEDVPTPPPGFHYELWFDIAGRPAPHNVGQVTVQHGRIAHEGALTEDLAVSVNGARLSQEPDFDDDPSISGNVIVVGTVDAATGLTEIQLAAAP